MLRQKALAEMQQLLDEMELSPDNPTSVYEVYYYDTRDVYHSERLFLKREDAVHHIEHHWGAKQITHNQDSWGGLGWTFYVRKREVE